MPIQTTQLSRMAFVIAMILPNAVCWAQNEKIVERCKNATALVDLGLLGSGTAFCVDAKGVFITNQHVVASSGLGGEVRLVLNSTEKQERVVIGKVVSWAEEVDLAVVQVRDVKGLVAIPVASSVTVKEVDSVTAYGFPFGNRLSTKQGSYPSISINTGKVTALRKKDRELKAIQIDVGVNPGNSGGPLVNDAGELIGIIVAGNQIARIAFAVPSDFATELLRRPALLVEIPDIPFADRQKEIPLTVEVLELTSHTAPDEIELEVGSGHGTSRMFREKVVNGTARFNVSPVDPGDASVKLRLTSRNGDESQRLDTPDLPLQVGEKQLHLSDFRRFDRRADYLIATCTSGRKIAGQVSGLENLKWNDGTKFDLGSESCIDVHGVNVGATEIQFELNGKRQGEAVATLSKSSSLLHPPVSESDHSNDSYASCVDELIVEARIGGVDEFFVNPMGLAWRHIRGEKPGEADGTTRFITINNRRWDLEWGSGTNSDVNEDLTAIFPMKMGYELWSLEPISIKADENSIHDPNRGKIAVREEGPNFIVQFDDVAEGASTYRFLLKKKYLRTPPNLSLGLSGKNKVRPSVDLPVSTWIDVLEFVDLNDHVLDGLFKRVEGGIVSSSSRDSRLILPIAVRGSYEIKYEFTRESGIEQMMFVLPIGDGACLFVVGAEKSGHGLQLLDGREIDAIPVETKAVSRPGTLENNRKYQCQFQVKLLGPQQVSVTAQLDDRPIINWTGRPEQLANSPWHPNPVGHGFTLRAGKSALKIHTFELKVASDARACRLGSDWKNSVTPVADHPPKEIEAKCLDWNGKKYFCSETPTNFNDAQKLAIRLQGRLVTISSREEETFLATHFHSRYLWLSAWRKGINPAWHDERNRTWKYQPTWASGQPNFGPHEFYATYCTFDASTGHLPGMNDVHAPVNFLVPCIEWGEEYPAAP